MNARSKSGITADIEGGDSEGEDDHSVSLAGRNAHPGDRVGVAFGVGVGATSVPGLPTPNTADSTPLVPPLHLQQRPLVQVRCCITVFVRVCVCVCGPALWGFGL